uniref:Uncharacterized protein n=1 Tax=uncultured Desulfobacterium sp. TaxID=201089 RepID=E1YKW8_9BACT|nr:unknown protein [uncultured Desulfobacterium sp.]
MFILTNGYRNIIPAIATNKKISETLRHFWMFIIDIIRSLS